MRRVPAAVLVFPGSNGERDLAEALARCGFEPRLVRSDEPLPRDVAVAGLPGGFSYGDYWRAGVLASRARAVRDLPEFAARGGLVIGICNGFQILVEAGMLPGALRTNEPPSFRHRWVSVRVVAAQPSPWLYGVERGTRLRFPMAHGEGNYFHPGGADAVERSVPLKYERNPNGSMADAAALLDSTGRIMGVMPHPERAADVDLGSGDGARIFKAAHAWLAREGRA